MPGPGPETDDAPPGSRQASAGVVAALQDALLADVGLVVFAFAMTVLLARTRVAPEVGVAVSELEAHPGQHELAVELVS